MTKANTEYECRSTGFGLTAINVWARPAVAPYYRMAVAAGVLATPKCCEGGSPALPNRTGTAASTEIS